MKSLQNVKKTKNKKTAECIFSPEREHTEKLRLKNHDQLGSRSLSLPCVLQEQVCFSRGQNPQLSTSCGPPQQKAACLALCYFPQSPYPSLSRWFKEREREGTFKKTPVWQRERDTFSLSKTNYCDPVRCGDCFFFSEAWSWGCDY